MAADHIFGLNLSNHAMTPETHLVVSPGSARDDTNSVDIVLPSGITKRLDRVFGDCDHEGGRDTSADIVGAFSYHVFVIRRSVCDQTSEVLFSQSAHAPALPCGYAYKRRVGSFLTNAAGQIIRAYWSNGRVVLAKPYLNYTDTSVATTALIPITVPYGVKVEARLNITSRNPNAPTGYIIHADPDAGPVAANIAADPNLAFRAMWTRTTQYHNQTVDVWTNATGQIYCGDTSGPGALMTIIVQGWYDPRTI